MPLFNNTYGPTTPFGINEFLRSTQDVKKESYTLAATTVAVQTIDGQPNQRILQPGLVLAKITSGPNAGKVGPYFNGSAGTSEAQTLTGTTVTAGVYQIHGIQFDDAGTVKADTGDIQWNAPAVDIQSAVDAAVVTAGGVAGSVVVTGGPVSTTPVVLTFNTGDGTNVATATIIETGLTGTIAVTTTTNSAAGPTDGRAVAANIVGINATAAPWQTVYGDLEVAVVYDAAVKQGWCYEYTAAHPTGDVLSNTTAGAMRPDGAAKVNGVAILFKS